MLKKFVRVAGGLALVGLLCGCKTSFRTVDAQFMAQPSVYRRVQILPVWFEGAGSVDNSLSTNELQAVGFRAFWPTRNPVILFA